MSIQVRAISEGFYGNALRLVGAEFPIKDKKDLGAWMVQIDDKGNIITDKDKTKVKDKDAEAKAKAEAEAAAALAGAKERLEAAKTAGDPKAIKFAEEELAKLEKPLV